MGHRHGQIMRKWAPWAQRQQQETKVQRNVFFVLFVVALNLCTCFASRCSHFESLYSCSIDSPTANVKSHFKQRIWPRGSLIHWAPEPVCQAHSVIHPWAKEVSVQGVQEGNTCGLLYSYFTGIINWYKIFRNPYVTTKTLVIIQLFNGGPIILHWIKKNI